MRNKSLPPMDMFGKGSFQYQQDYADLHNRFTYSIPFDRSPTNPERNGGVRYAVESLDHGTRVNGACIEGNNTSVVVMLLYEGVLFACPGDIEPLGWHELCDVTNRGTAP